MSPLEKEDFLERIKDVTTGRENLGNNIPISVYRLFEFSVRSAIKETYGKDAVINLLRKAGFIAGLQFAKENLDLNASPNDFVMQLTQVFLDFNMGIVRFEELDLERGSTTITISEDADCSGLPVIGETICNYDEGFLSAVLHSYTNLDFETIEIDCWAKGDRICRFQSNVITK